MPIECVRTDDGVVTTLRIAGQLDVSTAPELAATIDQVVEERRTHVVVDLGGLELIDGTGATTLVGLYQRVRATGGAVAMTNLQDQPRAIFKELGMENAFLL